MHGKVASRVYQNNISPMTDETKPATPAAVPQTPATSTPAAATTPVTPATSEKSAA